MGWIGLRRTRVIGLGLGLGGGVLGGGCAPRATDEPAVGDGESGEGTTGDTGEEGSGPLPPETTSEATSDTDAPECPGGCDPCDACLDGVCMPTPGCDHPPEPPPVCATPTSLVAAEFYAMSSDVVDLAVFAAPAGEQLFAIDALGTIVGFTPGGGASEVITLGPGAHGLGAAMLATGGGEPLPTLFAIDDAAHLHLVQGYDAPEASETVVDALTVASATGIVVAGAPALLLGGTSGVPSIWRDGQLTALADVDAPSSGPFSAVAAGDVSLDGVDDVVALDGSGNAALWHGDGQGGFAFVSLVEHPDGHFADVAHGRLLADGGGGFGWTSRELPDQALLELLVPGSSEPVRYPLGGAGTVGRLAIGQLDADASAELVVAEYGGLIVQLDDAGAVDCVEGFDRAGSAAALALWDDDGDGRGSILRGHFGGVISRLDPG